MEHFDCSELTVLKAVVEVPGKGQMGEQIYCSEIITIVTEEERIWFRNLVDY